jgi:hypothetical protein
MRGRRLKRRTDISINGTDSTLGLGLYAGARRGVQKTAKMNHLPVLEVFRLRDNCVGTLYLSISLSLYLSISLSLYLSISLSLYLSISLSLAYTRLSSQRLTHSFVLNTQT